MMIRTPITAAVIAGLFAVALAAPALAGPPLICHPIDIGNAKSLAWGGKGGFEADGAYDVKRLVDDTLAILTPNAEVIVRMETLRRATIYVSKHREVAADLRAALLSRVLDAEAAGRSDGLAWFDAGYLAQCYAQSDIPVGWKGGSPIGYDWAMKGLALRADDAGMEFALALMTVYAHSGDGKGSEQGDHESHLRKAVAGAPEGSLLARNLVLHFGKQGETMQELRTRYARRG